MSPKRLPDHDVTGTGMERLLPSLGFNVAVFCLFLGLASPCAADRPSPGRAYALAPGDRIVVTVFGQQELSGEMTVDGGGDIALPLIGSIAVEGLTPHGCEELIRSKLADGILNSPTVTVRIVEFRPLYIIGQVRAPGAYPFRYGSTVASAIAIAGGYGAGGPQQAAATPDLLAADERL